MTEELKTILTQGLAALGLTPPDGAVEKLSLYCDLLLEQNRVMNLTAITDPAEVVRLHFLDSLGKRVDWLRELCGQLELGNITCLKGRAEELSRTPNHREQYDGAVSRALASMPVLAELCLPFVKQGGLFLAMKSNKTDEEIDAARPVIGTLGGEPPFVMDYRLPGEESYRRIVTVFKRSPTPKAYPRKWSKIREARYIPRSEDMPEAKKPTDSDGLQLNP